MEMRTFAFWGRLKYGNVLILLRLTQLRAVRIDKNNGPGGCSGEIMSKLPSNVMRITGFCALIVFALIGNAYAQSTASVRGTVTDGQTQGYLPGATIELSGTTHRAKTGDDGRYRLDGVAAGTYSLIVSYVGYTSYEAEVTVGESGIAEHSITMGRVVQVADEIIVEGARFGQSKALNEQKESANIKNIISEEQIQSFPDLNTAEVLQRVSGVSIQRDNGEGRFVSLRGTSPSYTNITINGQQVAYSNGENRSV
jgi:hypothetical protein